MNVVIAPAFRGKTVAVALSGGADSMALTHYMRSVADKFGFSLVAVNVEHGIRGESSLRDSAFVKDYCAKNRIPLFSYKADAPKIAKEKKLSLEQAARVVRYDCFYDAINTGKCDVVVTAHHSSDNFESALFNLFRGTGVKGLIGIKDYDGKIFRPFINVTKEEISEYVKANDIPYVTDETNFEDDLSRNFLRLNVIPKIKELFPEAEKSVLRLAETLAYEDAFLDAEAKKHLLPLPIGDGFYIKTPLDKALFARATIFALKALGLKKDYEKIHVDDVYALCDKQTGKTVHLPLKIKAVKEYDRVIIYRPNDTISEIKPFAIGETEIMGRTVFAEYSVPKDLKSGFYADFAKIPENAVIRTKKIGDRFTKFGGGTKSLSDFLTDKKIPLKDRNDIIVLADGKDVLAVFDIAVSDKIKVDGTTEKIIKLYSRRI